MMCKWWYGYDYAYWQNSVQSHLNHLKGNYSEMKEWLSIFKPLLKYGSMKNESIFQFSLEFRIFGKKYRVDLRTNTQLIEKQMNEEIIVTWNDAAIQVYTCRFYKLYFY